MVSEKVIVILLIVAIVLSVISIVFTLSVNTDIIGKMKPQSGDSSSSNSANINLVVETPNNSGGLQ